MKLIDCEGKRGKGDLSFVKVPRWVFDWIYGKDDFERRCGQVYLALIVKSYFSVGKAVLGKSTYCCERGEWYSSQQRLADMLRMPYTCVRRAVRTLKDNCLIDTRRLKDGIKGGNTISMKTNKMSNKTKRLNINTLNQYPLNVMAKRKVKSA